MALYSLLLLLQVLFQGGHLHLLVLLQTGRLVVLQSHLLGEHALLYLLRLDIELVKKVDMLEHLADAVFVFAGLGVSRLAVIVPAWLDIGEGQETLLDVVAGLHHLLEGVSSQMGGAVHDLVVVQDLEDLGEHPRLDLLDQLGAVLVPQYLVDASQTPS